MKHKVLALLVLFALAGSVNGVQAQNTAEIYGKVTDSTGAFMPGVVVTLTSPVLLQPQTATTTETGSYRFPGLPIGVYTVKFELTGFKIVVREGYRLTLGESAQVNQALEISSMQETVTVTGETPLVDLRDTSKTNRFTQEALQSIPSARDPWVILEQTASVVVDRSNVGGSQSGQQSNFVARGAPFAQQKWNLDGIDITDMSATGGSPVYFDFDAFEEMQISTGGADVTMMTPGVGLNLVTKSGTDRLRGSARYYYTDDQFEAVNLTDSLRTQGATSGNPIQNIKDYGIEVGGPIKKGLAWFWGAYGLQDIKAGVNNFYKPDAACRTMKADLAANPLSHSIKDVWGCLSTDLTTLKNYNAKLAVAPFRNNQFSFFFNMAGKIRNARDASDLRPIETTYRQKDVNPDSGLGSKWWKTGLPKTYKWSDRHIFTDRFLVEVQYAHVGNNFVLDFHEDDLASVQPTYESYSPAGLWGRSYLRSIYVRPTDSIDLTGNYTLSGFLGGDHAIKFGAKYRNDVAHSETHYGGNAVDYLAYGQPWQARIYRDSYSEYQLRNRNIYVQDTYTRSRMTVNVGVRFDYQTDESRAGKVPAVPFVGQPTFSGTMTYCSAPTPTGCQSTPTTYTGTGQNFDQLQAVDFKGAKALNDKGYAYKNWSPRAGVTYDLTGNGRNVAKISYARYISQAGTGDLSSTYTTTGSTSYVTYPWADLNGDKVVTANEIVMIPTPLTYGGNYDYRNPTAVATPVGRNDPKIKMEHTDEIVVSFDKQIGSSFAVGASAIARKTVNFRASWTTDNTYAMSSWTSANYTGPLTYTPAASACTVAGALCNPVQYWAVTSTIPVYFLYTNRPGYNRTYKGFELTARKRMSHGWMANASYAWNDSPEYYPTGSYQDPTNISNLDGGQYAPQSTTSGIDNVFVNAKWIARLSGVYQVPIVKVNLAGFLNTRSGFPLFQYVTTSARASQFGQGSASVYTAKAGSVRLPNVTQLDVRIDKPVSYNRLRATFSLDIFNVLNGNTILAKRRQQNSSNANTVSAILAPRVLRFGVRMTF